MYQTNNYEVFTRGRRKSMTSHSTVCIFDLEDQKDSTSNTSSSISRPSIQKAAEKQRRNLLIERIGE
jgi:hypothetical protein